MVIIFVQYCKGEQRMKIKDGMSLPKVGDRLMRVMTGSNFGEKYNDPEPCVVVYVSKPKHYYTSTARLLMSRAIIFTCWNKGGLE